MRRLFQSYLLPGLLFQSVIISGGYSTGREFVEFFMGAGPLGGMAGMFLSMAIWSIVLALSFEFARIHKAYDYRNFFKALLGKGWVLFEFSFLAIAMVALAIIGAAAGAIFADMTSAPKYSGTVIMMIGIGILAFYGTALIEKVVSFWSLVLYAAYISLFFFGVRSFGGDIAIVIEQHADLQGEWLNALKYAGINLAAAPAVLFGVKHIQNRREAVWAGALAGPIAMTPGLLFYTVLLSQYPQVLDQEVPLIAVLGAMNMSAFALVFKIVIFGTYMETAVALVHSVNERIAGLRRERGKELSHGQRVLVAVLMLVTSVYLATTIGLIDLIAKGYGTLTYLILAIYILPLVTIGLMQIRAAGLRAGRDAGYEIPE